MSLHDSKWGAKTRRRRLATSLLVALLLTAGCQPRSSAVPTGTPAPPIKAQGWVQGTAPGNLADKVVVVDFWASWCGPCRATSPELVSAHRAYLPLGVEFVGVTGEGEEALPEITDYLRQTGINWPNGYGAVETFRAFGVEMMPTVVVIGADGRIAWNNHQPQGLTLAEAIDRALRAAAPAS